MEFFKANRTIYNSRQLIQKFKTYHRPKKSPGQIQASSAFSAHTLFYAQPAKGPSIAGTHSRSLGLGTAHRYGLNENGPISPIHPLQALYILFPLPQMFSPSSTSKFLLIVRYTTVCVSSTLKTSLITEAVITPSSDSPSPSPPLESPGDRAYHSL